MASSSSSSTASDLSELSRLAINESTSCSVHSRLKGGNFDEGVGVPEVAPGTEVASAALAGVETAAEETAAADVAGGEATATEVLEVADDEDDDDDAAVAADEVDEEDAGDDAAEAEETKTGILDCWPRSSCCITDLGVLASLAAAAAAAAARRASETFQGLPDGASGVLKALVPTSGGPFGFPMTASTLETVYWT